MTEISHTPILTDHLILRSLQTDDAKFLLGLAQNPAVTKYMDYLDFKDLAGATAWVAEKMHYNSLVPQKSFDFAILNREKNELVGWIGIGPSSDKAKGDLDFGYVIAPKFWGHGFATEALKAVLSLAWEKTAAQKIFGECRVDNRASAKVMEKAGMKFETKFVEDNHESLCYSILRC